MKRTTHLKLKKLTCLSIVKYSFKIAYPLQDKRCAISKIDIDMDSLRTNILKKWSFLLMGTGLMSNLRIDIRLKSYFSNNKRMKAFSPKLDRIFTLNLLYINYSLVKKKLKLKCTAQLHLKYSTL